MSSLLFPGLLIALASHQVVLIAMALAAGMFLLVDAVAGMVLLDGVSATVHPRGTATVGDPSPVVVRLGARRRVEVSIDVPRAAGPVAAMAPGRAELPLVVRKRAVFDRALVRVQTAAPFGLVTVARVGDLPFEQPLHVAPRAVAADVGSPSPVAGWLRGMGDGTGLRPYAPGDPPRDVHWPSAARAGYLLVRDRRSVTTPDRVGVVVVDDAGGEAPGLARSAIDGILTSGTAVELVTVEPAEAAPGRVGGADHRPGDDGPVGQRWVSGHVGTREELLVRLARTAPGRPAGPPPQPNGTEVALVVDGEGARWAPSS